VSERDVTADTKPIVAFLVDSQPNHERVVHLYGPALQRYRKNGRQPIVVVMPD